MHRQSIVRFTYFITDRSLRSLHHITGSAKLSGAIHYDRLANEFDKWLTVSLKIELHRPHFGSAHPKICWQTALITHVLAALMAAISRFCPVAAIRVAFARSSSPSTHPTITAATNRRSSISFIGFYQYQYSFNNLQLSSSFSNIFTSSKHLSKPPQNFSNFLAKLDWKLSPNFAKIFSKSLHIDQVTLIVLLLLVQTTTTDQAARKETWPDLDGWLES